MTLTRSTPIGQLLREPAFHRATFGSHRVRRGTPLPEEGEQLASHVAHWGACHVSAPPRPRGLPVERLALVARSPGSGRRSPPRGALWDCPRGGGAAQQPRQGGSAGRRQRQGHSLKFDFKDFHIRLPFADPGIHKRDRRRIPANQGAPRRISWILVLNGLFYTKVASARKISISANIRKTPATADVP